MDKSFLIHKDPLSTVVTLWDFTDHNNVSIHQFQVPLIRKIDGFVVDKYKGHIKILSTDKDFITVDFKTGEIINSRMNSFSARHNDLVVIGDDFLVGMGRIKQWVDIKVLRIKESPQAGFETWVSGTMEVEALHEWRANISHTSTTYFSDGLRQYALMVFEVSRTHYGIGMGREETIPMSYVSLLFDRTNGTLTKLHEIEASKARFKTLGNINNVASSTDILPSPSPSLLEILTQTSSETFPVGPKHPFPPEPSKSTPSTSFIRVWDLKNGDSKRGVIRDLPPPEDFNLDPCGHRMLISSEISMGSECYFIQTTTWSLSRLRKIIDPRRAESLPRIDMPMRPIILDPKDPAGSGLMVLRGTTAGDAVTLFEKVARAARGGGRAETRYKIRLMKWKISEKTDS
jgi:hypothetical protein